MDRPNLYTVSKTKIDSGLYHDTMLFCAHFPSSSYPCHFICFFSWLLNTKTSLLEIYKSLIVCMLIWDWFSPLVYLTFTQPEYHRVVYFQGHSAAPSSWKCENSKWRILVEFLFLTVSAIKGHNAALSLSQNGLVTRRESLFARSLGSHSHLVLALV